MFTLLCNYYFTRIEIYHCFFFDMNMYKHMHQYNISSLMKFNLLDITQAFLQLYFQLIHKRYLKFILEKYVNLFNN